MLWGLVNITDCLKVGVCDIQYRKERPASSFSDSCILGTINTFSYAFAGHTSVARNLSQATRHSLLGAWTAGHETGQYNGTVNDRTFDEIILTASLAIFCILGSQRV